MICIFWPLLLKACIAYVLTTPRNDNEQSTNTPSRLNGSYKHDVEWKKEKPERSSADCMFPCTKVFKNQNEIMELEVKAVKLGKEKFLSSTSFTKPGVFLQEQEREEWSFWGLVMLYFWCHRVYLVYSCWSISSNYKDVN